MHIIFKLTMQYTYSQIVTLNCSVYAVLDTILSPSNPLTPGSPPLLRPRTVQDLASPTSTSWVSNLYPKKYYNSVFYNSFQISE